MRGKVPRRARGGVLARVSARGLEVAPRTPSMRYGASMAMGLQWRRSPAWRTTSVAAVQVHDHDDTGTDGRAGRVRSNERARAGDDQPQTM